MKYRWRWPLLLVLGVVGLTVPRPPAVKAQQISDGQPGTQATSGGVQILSPTFLAQRPTLTPERQAALAAELERRARLRATRPMGDQVPVTEFPDGTLNTATDPSAPQPLVPGNPFVVEVSSALDPIDNGLPAGTIGEPSLAQTGGFVFYTGNWYAANAYTANPGPADWNYIDPSADMPDFCCDQDVIADRGRDMILWTRLGGTNGRFVLGASTDHVNFCTWELNPAQLGYGGGYDQPLMALTNNFVYISAQVYGPAFHSVMLKIALDTLQDCPGGFNYNWWDITSGGGWGGLAQGATTTMYYGSHRGTNNSFTVYYVPDNVNLLFTATNNIPAFTFQNRNSNCPVAGTNPCGRSDSRILTGWVRKGSNQSVGEVGFMWDAHEGGFFPWAYVEAVTLREDNLTVTGRPWIAFSNTAVEYPGASPNARGDLGLTTFYMGGGFYPDLSFFIADDYNPMWNFYNYLAVSNGSANAWGDYIHNRSFLPTQTGWSTASYTLENGVIVPRLVIVSRQRDAPGIYRYLTAP